MNHLMVFIINWPFSCLILCHIWHSITCQLWTLGPRIFCKCKFGSCHFFSTFWKFCSLLFLTVWIKIQYVIFAYLIIKVLQWRPEGQGSQDINKLYDIFDNSSDPLHGHILANFCWNFDPTFFFKKWILVETNFTLGPI